MHILYGRKYSEDRTCREDLSRLFTGGNGQWAVGEGGVLEILATHDGRVEFILQEEQSIALVKSPADYPVVYPLKATPFRGPAKAVLMDLDGTTVLSEEYWIGAIEETVSVLLDDPDFSFVEEDLSCVSGYSTREHLQYCITKYNIKKTIDEVSQLHREIREQHLVRLENSTSPLLKASPGLKEFLLTLKDEGVKIGLVTSASERKALLEIRSVFNELDMGDPLDFYDTIITAGFSSRGHKVSTLGALASKPHPWLYAEAARIGLGFETEKRAQIIGIEDTAAGVIALKLAGFPAIGMKKGNIGLSGVRPLLHAECEFLPELLPLLLGHEEVIN